MILKNIILSFHSPKRRSTVWLHLSEALEQAKSKAGREAVWLWRGKSGTFLFYVLMGFWRVERYTRRRLQETVNSRLKVPARQAFWLNPSDSFIVTTWGKGDKNHHSIRPGTQFRLPLSLLRAAHTGGHCAHTRSLLSTYHLRVGTKVCVSYALSWTVWKSSQSYSKVSRSPSSNTEAIEFMQCG